MKTVPESVQEKSHFDTNTKKQNLPRSELGIVMDIANPSEEHQMLRDMVRDFVKEHVEPQALEFDRDEKFNLKLLRSLGELGLLGITASEEFGGAGLELSG